MRGLQVRVAVPLLLNLIGLEAGEIRLRAVAIDAEYQDTLLLMLSGEDERLPEVARGARYPCGTVICEQVSDKPGIRGKIVVEDERQGGG